MRLATSRQRPRFSCASFECSNTRSSQGPQFDCSRIRCSSRTLSCSGPFPNLDTSLSRLLKFIADQNAPLWQGILLACGMMLASELRSLLYNYFFYTTVRMGVKTQATLISAVYRKVLPFDSPTKAAIFFCYNLQSMGLLLFVSLVVLFL